MSEELRRIVLHAVGDIGFGAALRGLTAGPSARDPFEHLRAALAGSEILFGNLETSLVEDPERPALREIRPGFGGEPSSARWLASAGFSIVSLANNHVMDYGPAGLARTIGALEEVGVAWVGAGGALEEARRAIVLKRGGLRIGFLAYAAPGPHSATAARAGAAPLAEPLILEDLRALGARADLIVLSLHFGLIYSTYPRLEDQELARRLCAAGATVVLGHHPHVLQGIERCGNSLIAYSLGEILFDPDCGYVSNRAAAGERRRAMILRVEVGPSGVAGFEIRPTLREPGGLRPRAAEGNEGREIVRHVESLSTPLAGDGLGASGLAAAAPRVTVSHQWAVFAHHLRHGNARILASWLVRLRPRHVRLALRALLGRSPRGRTP